jgi:hypothetical protein
MRKIPFLYLLFSSLLVAQLPIEQLDDNHLVKAGRDLSRYWYAPDGYPLVTPFIIYDGNPVISLPDATAGFGLFPGTDAGYSFFGSALEVQQDSAGTLRPYSKIHYNYGSYGYGSIYFRHHQYRNGWSFDVYGQNELADGAYPGNNGTKTNFNAIVTIAANDSVDYELRYHSWHYSFRATPIVIDTTIAGAAREQSFWDYVSFSRKGDTILGFTTRFGADALVNSGTWQNGLNSSRSHNLDAASLTAGIAQGSRRGAFRAAFKLGYRNGGTMFTQNDASRAYYQLSASLADSVGESFAYAMSWNSYGDESINTLNARAQMALLEKYEIGAGFTRFRQNAIFAGNAEGQLSYIEGKLKQPLTNSFSVSGGMRFAAYNNVAAFLEADGDKTHLSAQFAAHLLVKYLNVSLGLRQRLYGFEQQPEQNAFLRGELRFNAYRGLYLGGIVKVNYYRNYRDYYFDTILYRLTSGNTLTKESWSLDVRGEASVRNFTIYYEGTHLDAFVVSGTDYNHMQGYAFDLPRFRVGVEWMLFN